MLSNTLFYHILDHGYIKIKCGVILYTKKSLYKWGLVKISVQNVNIRFRGIYKCNSNKTTFKYTF